MGRGVSAGWKRAQVSLEYLTVIGLSMMMIFPLTFIFIQQSEGFSNDIRATHLEKMSNELIDAAEEVFYLGPPTQKRLQLYFPEGVQSISVHEQYIQFDVDIDGSIHSHYVDSSLPLNMSGTLPTFPGPHIILVRAENSRINISDVS